LGQGPQLKKRDQNVAPRRDMALRSYSPTPSKTSDDGAGERASTPPRPANGEPEHASESKGANTNTDGSSERPGTAASQLRQAMERGDVPVAMSSASGAGRDAFVAALTGQTKVTQAQAALRRQLVECQALRAGMADAIKALLQGD